MSKTRAYSQRLLPPFLGAVQIAQSNRVRAQSFDGVSWEIHYVLSDNSADAQQPMALGYALNTGYYKVGHYQNKQLTPYRVPAFLDAGQVADYIAELAEFLSSAKTPFPAADVFECWLLDAADASPLALIFSCCEESQIPTYAAQTKWTAVPSSKLKIEQSDDEHASGEAPVNHRLEELVAKRSGPKPRTAWFKRTKGDDGDFPALLLREDWQSQTDHDLCQRYLMRKAPRLLVLQGLSHGDRERLEVAAKKHAIEVDELFPLYPEVNDESRMAALRVEARLRRGTPQGTEPSRKKAQTNAPLSKEMRILE